MSSVVMQDETGQQVDLDRSNWFSAEAISLLEAACNNPAIGPDKVLANLLHFGLGLPLSLIGRLTGSTKNVVAKQVITGRRRMRRMRPRERVGQGHLF